MTPDYLLLGHFTRDVLPDGALAPGGTSLYAALTAHRLGQRVAVVSAPAELPAAWDSALPGPIRYRLWRPADDLLARIDALVLSIEDVKGDEELVAGYARHCALVALTRGAQGATLFVRGQPHHIEAFPAIERDPTGAGDVFAAALLVRLRETGDPFEAARFAACVAAGSVEGQGASRIPTRAEVEQRLAAKVEWPGHGA
jgi:sugar/nucleoside kinase (ribokinase family)